MAQQRKIFTVASIANASGYVLSGCSQPLILELCKSVGVVNPIAQTYMLFYYLGPSVAILPLLRKQDLGTWPKRTVFKAIGTALFDITATSLNYTGSELAGPTIFAIIYSSVTVWTGIFSQLVLHRKMNVWQWLSVATIFLGLSITATDSLQLGDDVVRGLVLVVFGSAMHAMTYIFCEAIMTDDEAPLSVMQICGVQGTTACIVFFAWQLIYTVPRWEEIILDPVQKNGGTLTQGFWLLCLFGFVNWIHSITYYETLLHFPGGSTSAGVFKGLQAVLVFVFTHVIYCGKFGGPEMCFTEAKFLSLVTVVGGVIAYGHATHRSEKVSPYEKLEDAEIEVEPVHDIASDP